MNPANALDGKLPYLTKTVIIFVTHLFIIIFILVITRNLCCLNDEGKPNIFCQAEAGIAVKQAMDAAKVAASLVLLEDGLSVIVDAITVGRTLPQRALTWVINKITKTFQTILVILVGMLWLRKMTITPMGIAVLLLANDFLTITISTDNARPSKRPATWNVKNIMIFSLPLSIAMLA